MTNNYEIKKCDYERIYTVTTLHNWHRNAANIYYAVVLLLSYRKEIYILKVLSPKHSDKNDKVQALGIRKELTGILQRQPPANAQQDSSGVVADRDPLFPQVHELVTGIRCDKVALEWDGKAVLTDADKAALSMYAGFGGIKAVLYPETSTSVWEEHGATKDDLLLHGKVMELHGLFHKHSNDNEYKNVLRSLKNSVRTAFYKPVAVPDTLYSAIYHHAKERHT